MSRDEIKAGDMVKIHSIGNYPKTRYEGEIRKVDGVKGGDYPYHLAGIDDWWSPCSIEKVEDDPVSHPSHYTSGNIECADALDAMVSAFEDPVAAALSWQVGKYVWRHPLKEKPIQDLKKARWYLDRLIKHLEGKK